MAAASSEHGIGRYDLVILNGIVVTASDVVPCHICVKGGKVAQLCSQVEDADLVGAEVLDAQGAYVTPGGIDGHVHLCQDLGLDPSEPRDGSYADDFETGSRSAAAGGTTTMLTFAAQTRSSLPQNRSLLQVVDAYDARAKATGSYVDYGYHVILARADRDVLAEEMPRLVERGITSVKLYMTYAEKRLSDGQLLDIMFEARKNKITTLIHAENGDAVEWLTDKLEERGWLAPWYHALSRPPLIESEATQRAIALAELIQNPILFVHVGSVLAANQVRAAQNRGIPIYAETCPQYFQLTWQDLQRFHDPHCFENSKHVCSPPPPPDDTDREDLYVKLQNGTFTVWSSDHCPFRYDDARGKPAGVLDYEAGLSGQPVPALSKEDLSTTLKGKIGSFKLIPNGIPGLETRLPLLYTSGVQTGRISIQKFVELTATNPARIYGLYPQKGTIAPGSDADFVIWYPDDTFLPFKLTNSMLHHNVDYTPYEGMEFTNWPRHTVLRGNLVWSEGKMTGRVGDGQFVKRGASRLRSALPPLAKDKRSVASWLYDTQT